MDKVSLSWEAPEYHHYERSNDWFWAVGLITISVAALAFIYDNALFGILIILSAIILIAYVRREPEMVQYELNQRGVMINNDLHPYLTLESFWMETRSGEPKLILKSKRSVLPYITIPVHDESADDVADFLREFIEEKEMREPTSHKVMEYLGF